MSYTINKKNLDLKSQSSLEQKAFDQWLMGQSIDLAIREDLGSNNYDLTSEAVIDKNLMSSGFVYLKQAGVIAGLTVFAQVIKKLDPTIALNFLVEEGAYIESFPKPILSFRGLASSILRAERLGLNLLQRMSGIATYTHQFVEMARPHGIAILDTRKTTPCLRAFERYAVRIGGGINHRFGLFDAVLIKDNHIKLAGSITKAVKSLRQKHPKLSIEVETATLTEVLEALNCNVDRIMLDNMTPDLVQEAIKLIRSSCFVEVSGGITLQTLSDYLLPGVDAISVGALTHSAPSIDISLEIEELI